LPIAGGLMKVILRLKSLGIENGNSSIKLIFDLGPSYSELFPEVRFGFLSRNSIHFFFEHFCIEDIGSDIWCDVWLDYITKLFMTGVNFVVKMLERRML
jgi:hypothetical protein